jgi:hypothetical protein
LSARNHSRYLTLLANDYLSSLNVAFNLTVDLQHAAADNVQAWPMILRSFPITDFSPLEGALMDGWAPLAPVGRVERDSIGLGSAEELRVNIEVPQGVRASTNNHGTRMHRGPARRFNLIESAAAVQDLSAGEAWERPLDRFSAVVWLRRDFRGDDP